MPLKIKGDQIKHSSIALENLEDIESGKILGRGSNDGTGTTSLISSQDIRNIAGLSTTDNVQFFEINGDEGVFASLDSDGSVIFKSDLSISGNLVVKGDKTDIDTSNLKIDDPIMYLSKGNTSDLLDIGIIGSYKSTDSASSIISNNSFDSDISSDDWIDNSRGLSSDYYVAWSSSGKNLSMNGKAGSGFSYAALIYQDVEFVPDTSGNKSYKFTIEFKVGTMHPNSYLALAIWDRSETPITNQLSNSEEYEITYAGNLPNTQTYGSWGWRTGTDWSTISSPTVTPSSSSLSNGFKISIQVGNTTNRGWNPSAYYGNGSVDNVKIYEVDIATGEETEVLRPFEKYSGIFRDSSDGKFKLFDTGEDLSSSTTVTPNYTHISGYQYSVGKLVADIEGDITFSTNRTFTLSGDLGGSATFDGSSSVNISSTIQDNSIQYTNVDFLVDEDNMSSDSETKVPTQQSVKAYVDSSISTGGFSDLEVKDIKMVSEVSSGVFEFVKVKYIIDNISVNSSDESLNYVTISTAIDSEFESLSTLYINGQRFRYSSDNGSNNDYWISESGTRINFSSGLIKNNDQIEIKYFIKS